MPFYSLGDLLPYYPTPPFLEIDHIIIALWDRHLELELASPFDKVRTEQHLEVTAAVIEFWEEKLEEINNYEVQQRRSDRDKND
mgnify:CR=1 FL=1|tara:strand:+ start:3078 stop:3329 length:252 start_codon:yes stop_codon:yes gene_type:complete